MTRAETVVDAFVVENQDLRAELVRCRDRLAELTRELDLINRENDVLRDERDGLLLSRDEWEAQNKAAGL